MATLFEILVWTDRGTVSRSMFVTQFCFTFHIVYIKSCGVFIPSVSKLLFFSPDIFYHILIFTNSITMDSMDISNKFKALIGSKIRFRTYDGEYEGIVKSVSLQTKQVTVDHVYSLSQNVYIGNSTFFFYEFLTYSILYTFSRHPEVRRNELSLDSKMNCSKSNCCTSVSFKDLSEELEQLVVVEDPHFSEFVLKLPQNLQHLLPSDSVILDSIDLEFQSATNHISRQNVLGVSFHGYKISRTGELIWICIATTYCVFLFDIKALGRSAFDNGLRYILQSQNIVKVIHDCRRPSDCLLHLFSTTLANVFDTQVADFMVNKQRFGNNSNFINVTSLDKCLVNYLAVPEKFLFVNKKPWEQEGNCLSRRPIDNECRNGLIKEALYLIILREKLTKLMLNSVYKASNLYLKAVAEGPALTSKASCPSVIPPALLAQGLEILAFRKDSLKTSAPTSTTELKHSSQTTNAGENEFPDRDACETVKRKFDYCLDKNISNIKLKSKSKSSINADNRGTSDYLAKDITQKYPALCRKFVCDKIHDNGKSKKPVSRISSGTFRDPAVEQSKDSVSKFDVTKKRLKGNVANESPKKVTKANTETCSESISQNEWRDMNGSASNITNDSVSDYSDTWAKLRSAFSAMHMSDTSVRNSKKNIKIVPSGMGC